MQFRTLLYSPIDQISLPTTFKVEPFELKTLGTLSKVNYQLHAFEEPQNAKDRFLTLRDITIPEPSNSDDTVSSIANNNSAISIAKEINNLAGHLTKIYADIETTALALEKLDFSKTDGVFGSRDLNINGVNLQGTGVTSIPAFVQLINNNASATGVQASTPRSKDSKGFVVRLYADDGRNIEIGLSQELLAVFGEGFHVGSNVFLGNISLRSHIPFEVEAGYPIFGFTGKQSIGGYRRKYSSDQCANSKRKQRIACSSKPGDDSSESPPRGDCSYD